MERWWCSGEAGSYELVDGDGGGHGLGKGRVGEMLPLFGTAVDNKYGYIQRDRLLK